MVRNRVEGEISACCHSTAFRTPKLAGYEPHCDKCGKRCELVHILHKDDLEKLNYVVERLRKMNVDTSYFLNQITDESMANTPLFVKTWQRNLALENLVDLLEVLVPKVEVLKKDSES